MAQHGSATRAMLRARDLLVRGGFDVTCISRTSLLCTGVACMRRVHSEVESEENSSLMKTRFEALVGNGGVFIEEAHVGHLEARAACVSF